MKKNPKQKQKQKQRPSQKQSQELRRQTPPGTKFIDVEEGLKIADEIFKRNKGAFDKLAKL